MLRLGQLIVFGLILIGTAYSDESEITSQGVKNIRSKHSVSTTTERAKRILEHHEFRIFGVIDHAQNAQQANLNLPATQLIVFGQPLNGTALMNSNRLIGLDLPMKLLIWEDAQGAVWVSYNSPEFLMQRHQIYKERPLFKKMQQVLDSISEQAGQ